MKRRRVFLTVMTLVLVLVTALGVLSACNPEEQTVKFTVTFKNGETVVKTAEVDSGTQLTAEFFPEDPTPAEGMKFDGWFLESAQIQAGYKVTGNVVFTAKFSEDTPPAPVRVTIEFKLDAESEAVKSVTVDEGAALTAEQIPDAPQAQPAKVFLGWYVGGVDGTKVEAGYVVNENTTAIAEFEDVPFAGFDAAMVGTWTSKDGETTVVITADSITYNTQSGTALCSEEIASTKYYYFTVADTQYLIYEDLNSGHLMVGVKSATERVELSKDGWDEPNPPKDPIEVTIPTDFVGTWVGADMNVVVATDGLTVNGVAAVFYEEPVTSGFGTKTWTFEINSVTYNVDVRVSGTDKALLCIYTDGGDEIELSKYVGIDEEYFGNYIIDENAWALTKLEVKADGITYIVESFGATIEVVATDIKEMEEGGYSFHIPSEEMPFDAALYFKEEKLYFYDGTDEFELTVQGEEPGPVDPAEIPDELIGDWMYDNYSRFVFVSITKDTFTVDGKDFPVADATYDSYDGWVFTIDNTEYNIFIDTYYGGNYIMIGGNPRNTYELIAIPETVTITFKDGSFWNSATLKTVEIPFNTSIPDSEYPSDPEKLAHTFNGWLVDGDESLEDTTKFMKDTDITADWTRVGYVVTFKCDGIDDVVKVVNIESGKATIPASFIPGAMAGDGQTFIGYYNDTTKAEVGLEITEDIEFTAMYVTAESYSGVWYSSDTGKETIVFFSGENNEKITIGVRIQEVDYTVNTDGSITYETGSGYNNMTYTLTVIGEKMLMKYSYFDQYGDSCVDEFILTKGAAVDYAGTYVKFGDGTSKLVISDGGVLINYNGTVQYAKITKTASGNKGSLSFIKTETGSKVTVNIEFDARGNLIITEKSTSVENAYKGLWVKDSAIEKNNSKYTCGNVTLVKHIVNDEPLWVWSNDEEGVYGYVTVDGEVVKDAIITVTFNDVEYPIQITDTSAFKFAGEEKGTYTGSNGEITLDGFGGATVGDATDQKYYLVGADVAVIGETGLKLNYADKTYTVLEADSVQGFYQNQKQYNTSYWLTLDGFGGTISQYGKTASTFYFGTYTLNDDGTVTINDTQYVTSGTYKVEQNGEVLVLADEKGATYYLKDGCSVNSQIAQFTGANNGWWKNDADEYVTIDIENGIISIGDLNEAFDSNWNGTLLSFSKYISGTGNVRYIFTIVDGQLSVKIGDAEALLYTSAPQPVVEADAFKGGWTGDFLALKGVIFYFDGFGKGTYNDTSKIQDIVYTYNADKSQITVAIGQYTHKFTVSGNNLVDNWEDDDYNEGSFTLVPATADAVAGVWNPPADDYNKYVLTFDGFGTVLVQNKSFKGYVRYTLTDNKVTFSANWDDWTCTINGNSMEVKSLDSDGYVSVNCTYTREAAEEPAIFSEDRQGTYTFYHGYWEEDMEIVVDANSITVDGTRYSGDTLVQGDYGMWYLGGASGTEDYRFSWSSIYDAEEGESYTVSKVA